MNIPATEYELTDAELRALWPGARAPMFAEAQTSPSPLAVFVGAQPGAGKTRTIARVRTDHPDRRFVTLDSDVLRRLHPRFDEIMQRDPTRMPVLTNQAASAWFRMGIADARAGGYDVIIENTLHNPDDVLAEAQRFTDQGYRVDAVVLAVPEADSRLGTVGRYFAALNEGDPARWTNNASHDRGYTGAPITVAALEASPAVDRVMVTDRQGTVHYDTQDPTNTDPSAAAALQRVRSIPKSPEALTEWVTRWQAVQQLAVTYGIDEDPSVVPVFRRLVVDAAAFINAQESAADREELDPAPRASIERLRAVGEQSQSRRSRPTSQHSAGLDAEPLYGPRSDENLGKYVHDNLREPGHGRRH